MPVAANKRIVGYDLARALAVFGMVVVNFKIVMGMGSDPGVPTWLGFLTGLLEGRAAATFVVLAGVGLSLSSRTGRVTLDRSRIARDRRGMLIRAAFLFVVGLLYTPIWPADILHFYGIYIAVGALMINAPSRWIWAAAGAAVAAFPLMIALMNYEQGWDWATLHYDGFWTPAGMTRHLFFNGFHPVFPWVGFLLIGMLLGRLDLTDPAKRRRVICWGAGLALLAESLSWLLIRFSAGLVSASEQGSFIDLIGTGPMPPMPLYIVAGSGTACFVIAVSVWVGERWGGSPWLRPLISTGQLALTLYVAHVIVGMGTLEAMGRLEGQTLRASVLASAIFCASGVVFSYLWRLYFKQGPLEAIMRTLTKRATQSPL